MSTKANTKQPEHNEERVDEIIGTALAVGAGGALLAGLGKLFFGNTKNTPEQLAQLRASVVTIRKYLGNIRQAYDNAWKQYGMFAPIAEKLNAFWKQTEAAYASNNPKQIKQAMQQAATVAAYATRFAELNEDIKNLIESHADDLKSGDASKREAVFKMLSDVIVRELTAVNLDKLGVIGKQLAIISPNLKQIPAPAGLTPKDFAADYITGLKQGLEIVDAERKNKAPEKSQADDKIKSTDRIARTSDDSEQVARDRAEYQRLTSLTANALRSGTYTGTVMEQHKALSESVSKIRLESLKEYKSVFEGSLKQLLAEQEESGIDKFLAASAMVARGVNQAQRKSASTTPATEPMRSVAPGQQAQLTTDQVKRVQTMLRSVTSVMGRLTPDQKKQFSSLLGRLKQAIG